MTRHTCLYANLPHTRQTPDEVIYENLRPQVPSDASGGPPVGGESQLDPATPEPPWDSHHTTVWLSDSWKYNTIKRAPDFNIFEFSNMDTKEGNERGNKSEQQPHQAKDKRKFRSRLPTFGRKRDKENKDKQDSTMKTPPGYGRGKDRNQQVNKTPEERESSAGVHKARTSRRPLTQSDRNGEGARSKDPSPYSSDSDSQISRSWLRSWRGVSRGTVREEQQRLVSGRSGSESTASSDSSSCVSPLISPSLSLRSLQLRLRDGGSPLPSPTFPRPHIYSKTREDGTPQMPAGLLRRDSSQKQRSLGSLEKLPRQELCPGRPSRHALPHHPVGDGRGPGGAAPCPGSGGQRSPQVEGTPALLHQTQDRRTQEPHTHQTHPEAQPQPGRPG